MYPKSIQKVIEKFRMLPGVGEKAAERYATTLMSFSNDDVTDFARAMVDMKNKVRRCSICGNLTEEDTCEYCKDETRDTSIICVVQQPKDLYAIEKTGYHGLYHVLNGAISTTKGILPEDININTLFSRLDAHVTEVVIATNPTMDGETTALYLTKLLKDRGILVTRLATGLPMGANLDYADELTLIKSFEGRIKQ